MSTGGGGGGGGGRLTSQLLIPSPNLPKTQIPHVNSGGGGVIGQTPWWS